MLFSNDPCSNGAKFIRLTKFIKAQLFKGITSITYICFIVCCGWKLGRMLLMESVPLFLFPQMSLINWSSYPCYMKIFRIFILIHDVSYLPISSIKFDPIVTLLQFNPMCCLFRTWSLTRILFWSMKFHFCQSHP